MTSVTSFSSSALESLHRSCRESSSALGGSSGFMFVPDDFREGIAGGGIELGLLCTDGCEEGGRDE